MNFGPCFNSLLRPARLEVLSVYIYLLIAVGGSSINGAKVPGSRPYLWGGKRLVAPGSGSHFSGSGRIHLAGYPLRAEPLRWLPF